MSIRLGTVILIEEHTDVTLVALWMNLSLINGLPHSTVGLMRMRTGIKVAKGKVATKFRKVVTQFIARNVGQTPLLDAWCINNS
jgi:hypothetical protein